MASRERPADRGSRQGRAAQERIETELREARIERGLSVAHVAKALGISKAEVSRIENHRSPNVPFIQLARFAAVVGLDLSLKTYPGASPVRAAAHGRLLDDLRALLHASLRWAREVPLPITGDQRAWDGMVIGRGWRFGIEAEMAARDAQALVRRINLKLRDGGVDGVLLLLRDTHRSRTFVRAARPELESTFSASPREVFASLRAGRCPSGSAILVVPYRPREDARASSRGMGRRTGEDAGAAA